MIELATPADRDFVAAVEMECFGADAWSTALIDEAIGARQVLIAADSSGYAVVRVVADVADLDRIAVRPAARREGAGRALLEAAIAHAMRLGAARMLLEVAADNRPARELYGGSGFVEISQRRGYYASGVDALILQRELSTDQ